MSVLGIASWLMVMRIYVVAWSTSVGKVAAPTNAYAIGFKN